MSPDTQDLPSITGLIVALRRPGSSGGGRRQAVAGGTGPVASKPDNPALPTQPREIAEEVHQAYRAGAAVAHIHLRDSRDRPTADLKIAERTMSLIAERGPILIQLSTGVGLSVPFSEREALVELRS